MDINWEQLQEESGIYYESMIMKGDIITFYGLSKEDEVTIRKALETHIPQPIINNSITNQDIMNKLIEMEITINARN